MRKSILGYFLIGIFTCFFLIGISSPSFGFRANPTPIYSGQAFEQEILANADTVFIAQAGEKSKFVSYSANLNGNQIVPSPVNVAAFGEVGAVLNGSRLLVRGGFRNLSSELRDYAADPLNPPNPNITSGIHLHRGATNENGPFQFALQVSLDPGGLSGTFSGDLNLSDEQVQAFTSGKMYVDLHTKSNRAGELRGLLKPA
jgi:CHRD domain